jgi:hypothetical protein
MSKVSPTTTILEYVASRSLPVTRQEIINGTGLRQDQVRKATNEAVLRGRLATELDEMGVTYYMTPEHNEEKITKEWPTLVSDNTEMLDKLKTHRPNKPESAWGSIVEEAEQRGFAKGYAIGVQEAQRAAYELGKSSVISKLTAVLS